MFSANTYTARRHHIAKSVGTGFVLIMGNEESPKNYHDNVYTFRQDSNFLYTCGIDQAGLHLGIDCATGKSILFGTELTLDDIVWTGPQPSLRELADQVGIDEVKTLSELANTIAASKDNIHYLPPYRNLNIAKLKDWLGVKELAPSRSLIDAVIELRSVKSQEEIDQIEQALVLTRSMHHFVRDNAEVGMLEATLSGSVAGMAQSLAGDLAYPVILTINGHVLHNHFHGNTLEAGQLILGDFGCETPMHYASDITRTWPVDKVMTAQQKEIYKIVLDSHTAAVDALAPGIAYKDIHIKSSEVIAQGLKDLGLMKGNVKDAVAAGAHALFFPHGLGHMMGLDVHDMEDLGEDLVGYDSEVKRSEQFGLKSLRLGKKLQPGHVLTVEPGVYFIPQLIDQWKADKKHHDFINYEALSDYRNFSGIRLEDNYLIDADGSQLLGPEIDK